MSQRRPLSSFLCFSRKKSDEKTLYQFQPAIPIDTPKEIIHFRWGDPLWIKKGLLQYLPASEVDEILYVMHQDPEWYTTPLEEFCCMVIVLKLMYFPSDFEWMKNITRWGPEACKTTKEIFLQTEVDMMVKKFTSSKNCKWLPLPLSATL